MRVLLSGGFGFLGGRVAERLRARGHHVIVSGRTTPADAARWAEAFEVRHANLVTGPSLDTLTQGAEAVVHLAALNENEAARSPEDAARLSVDATARLFESSKRAGARAFVFASTFHVYGAPPGAVIDESTPPSPAHPYGAAHLGGELRCHELHSDSCRAVILRISNVYGAPARLGVDRWTLAHNEFCTRAARREAIVFKSAGLQHRDFVWVEDVADAIDLALGPASMSAAPVVWNVGGENSRSVYSLATLVCERARTILGWSPPIERPEPAAGDREVPVRFSISRLRSAGYEPHDRLLEETDRLIGMLARRAN